MSVVIAGLSNLTESSVFSYKPERSQSSLMSTNTNRSKSSSVYLAWTTQANSNVTATMMLVVLAFILSEEKIQDYLICIYGKRFMVDQ